MLIAGHVVTRGEPTGPPPVQAGESTTTTAAPTPSTTIGTTTTSLPPQSEGPPPREAAYQVSADEAEPAAKQLAVDIAHALTTYEESTDHMARLQELEPRAGASSLAEVTEALTYPGSWSRGQAIYPQLGGFRNDRTSVMVVTRQTVGSGSETHFSLVRTLDVRLVRGDSGWEFDFLSSAGGTFEDLGGLQEAHAVAEDPRIEMPDSARLDILSGLATPTLLTVMSELADQTGYGVVTISTGHPLNVFETDRQSHHTVGQAVDIYRIGDRNVIDDRGEDSTTRIIVEWLYDHPDVLQVGSPWDLDGPESRRSFTDPVHQDHIHLAVKG